MITRPLCVRTKRVRVSTQTNQTNQTDKPPERIALGAVLSLTESTTKLFGRSIFKLNVLALIEGTTLVVTAVEYGMGALVLLLIAYGPYLLWVMRHRNDGRPRGCSSASGSSF